MEITTDMVDGTMCIALEGEMTVLNAGKIRDAFLDAVDSSSSLKINLEKVSEIDTTGIQLLISAQKSAAKGAEFIGQSEDIVKAVRSRGVQIFNNRG